MEASQHVLCDHLSDSSVIIYECVLITNQISFRFSQSLDSIRFTVCRIFLIISESVKACKSLPKVSAMNKPIKFDLSVKYPWDRVKTIAAVHIYIDDRMTKWRLIVQNTSGIVKFSVNSSFFGGFNPRQILIEKKVYNFKGNNLYSDIIESNQILGESYDIDDYMIDESALKQLGYEKPDDLTIVCCFKVLPNYGTFVSIDDDFEIHRGDFDLICSDGQKVKVHKNVISNQSAALKRQLKRSSSEVESCKAMKIMYPSEVVREIVRYVYTGNLNRVEGKERELLQIAAEVLGWLLVVFLHADSLNFTVSNQRSCSRMRAIRV